MRSESEREYVRELERSDRPFMFVGSAVERFTKRRHTFNIVAYGHDLESAQLAARRRSRRIYPTKDFCRVSLKERNPE